MWGFLYLGLSCFKVFFAPVFIAPKISHAVNDWSGSGEFAARAI
jgi:hypothetical protein